MLFNEMIKIGNGLKCVRINLTISKCLIWLYVIIKADNFNFDSFFRSNLRYIIPFRRVGSANTNFYVTGFSLLYESPASAKLVAFCPHADSVNAARTGMVVYKMDVFFMMVISFSVSPLSTSDSF